MDSFVGASRCLSYNRQMLAIRTPGTIDELILLCISYFHYKSFIINLKILEMDKKIFLCQEPIKLPFLKLYEIT